MMVEILCCALSGAAFSFENDSYFEPGNKPRIGHAILAVDPAALAGADSYFDRLEVMLNALTQDDGVRLPGARRHADREKSKAHGVEIPDTLLSELEKLASAPAL
jgi:(2R)-3-sulfolactate dehydrogenase (NADP+)